MSLDPDVIKVIAQIAWPVTVATLLLLFQKELKNILKEIADLISRIKNLELEYKGTKLTSLNAQKVLVEASEMVDKKEKLLESKNNTNLSDYENLELNPRLEKLGFETTPSNLSMTTYERFASEDQGAALMVIRRDLEVMMRNIGKTFGVIHENEAFHQFVDKLLKAEALDPEQGAVAKKLYAVCSSAAHGTIYAKPQMDHIFSIVKYLKVQFVSWLNFSFPEDQPKGNS